MAITAETRTDIIDLVVAALDVAPGTTLLNELVALVDGGGSLADVAANLTARADYQAKYPAFQTSTEWATEWLGNLIPEASTETMDAAVTLVAGMVNAGSSQASIILEAATFLTATTTASDATYGTVATAFVNNSSVASYYTVDKENADVGTSTLSGVDSTAASVTTANAAVDTVSAPAVAAEAFTMTKNLDTKTTGAGDDQFNSTNNSTANTLTSGDSIDGGAGTDSLTISNTVANAALATGVTAANIETVRMNAVAATTLDMALFSGVTDIYNNGSLGDLVLGSVGSYIPNVHLVSSSADTTVNWLSAATTVGDSDAMTVAMSAAATTSAANLTANGIETFNVLASTASGSATNSQTLTSSSARSVVVTGDATTNITVNLAGAGATDALAGTVTGNSAANIFNVTADSTDKITVDTGAGDDSLTMSTVGALFTLTGGDGTDTLSFTQASASGVSSSATLSGWETLGVTDAGTGTIDMDSFSGVSKVVYDAGLGAASTVDDAVTGIEVEVDVTATAQNLTVDLKTDGSADAVTVTLDAIGAGDNIGTINASDAETLTISVDDDTTDATGTIGISSITLGDATTVTISGDANTTVSGATNPTTPVLTTLNAGGMTDIITLSGINFAAAGATVTLGTGADSLTMGTADGADTIDLSAGGKNTIVYTALGQSDAAGMDVIKGFVSGSDDIDLRGLANENVITTTQFGGVGATKTAAEGKLGGTNSASVVFQADDSVLWVDINNDGVLNASDFRVQLEGVSTIAATDLKLSSAGNAVSLTAAGATASTTVNTNASKLTTNESDTITTTLTNADTSTVTAAGGTADSLTVSAVVGGTTIRLNTAAASVNTDMAITGVETVSLAQTTAGITTVNGVPTDVSSLTVTGASAALAVSATANSQTFNSSANTDAANASTIAIGAFNTTVTTGAGADIINTIQQDGSTITTGAGNDTFNITNVAAYDDDATLLTLIGGTGTDSLVFADALTVAVDFTDTTDISLSSIETLNLGQVGGASTATLSTANEFTSIAADTTNSTVTITGTGSQLSEVTTLTNTNGTNVFNITVSDAGATYDLSTLTTGGANEIDVITFQATGSNVLKIDGADIAKYAGTPVAAGTTDTLQVALATVVIPDNTFNAFETLELVGTAALDIDITDSGLDVARTITGDVGDNTITLTAVAAAKSVNISSGGTDTVVVAMDATALTTITGFTPGASGDVLNLVNADNSAVDLTTTGPILAAGVTINSDATDADEAFIFASTASQISGLLSATGNGGSVEAAIIAAGLVGATTIADGEFFIAAIDNGTDTGIYRVTANDTALIDASDIDGITQIATLVGVTADQLVSANVI